MKEWTPIVISVVTLAFVIIAFFRSGGWHSADRTEDNIKAFQESIKEIEIVIRELVSEHQQSDNEQFAAIHRDSDAIRRETGEMGSALRQKVQEVELYIRDTFLRKQSFETILGSLTGDIRIMGEKIESRLLRMENKIDTKT